MAEEPLAAEATEPRPAAAASPRPRRPAGPPKLGAHATEEEAERAEALRQRTREARQRSLREAAVAKQRELLLAEEYRRHLDEKKAALRSQREQARARSQELSQRRSAHLGSVAGGSILSLASSRPPEVRPAWDILESDPEYRELFERYGHRLKAPQTSRVEYILGSARGPRSPRKPQPRAPMTARPSQVGSYGASRAGSGGKGPGASRAASCAETALQETGCRLSSQLLAAQPGIPEDGQQPSPRRRPGRLLHVATAVKMANALERTLRPSHGSPSGRSAQAQEADGLPSWQAGPADEEPEPCRSLMPRKEALRRRQQELLKNTDCAFYRKHLRRHFQRILDSVELTFTDAAGQKEQARIDLAKPLPDEEHRRRRV